MCENLRLPLSVPSLAGQIELPFLSDESLTDFARRVASGEVRPFKRDVLLQLLGAEPLVRRKGGRR